MGNKKDRAFWESAAMNNATYRFYYDRLVELSVSMFKWDNVPETVDIRFLELVLFAEGQCVFFKDEELGYLALQNMLSGNFNQYRIPIDRRAYAINGYQRQLTDKDSVIIYNNYMHTNSMPAVSLFARKLYNLDRIIDTNTNAQKTPILLQCDENELLTLQNAYKKYEGNEPMIAAPKALNNKGFTVLKTDAPYISDKIYSLKTQIWNEALTYLGISNVNVQKKERLISDEVMRNQGGVIASRYSRLEARRDACKMINSMFGLNMDCSYRDDYREFDYTDVVISDETSESEGENNE